MYCTCFLAPAGCVVILVVYRWLFLQWPRPPATVITVTAAIALQFYANSSSNTNNQAMCQWKTVAHFLGPTPRPLSHFHVHSTCDAGKYWLQIGGKQPTRGRARQAHITLLQLKSKWRTLWRRQGKLNSPESQGKQINVAFFCNIKNKELSTVVRVAIQIEFRVNIVCIDEQLIADEFY